MKLVCGSDVTSNCFSRIHDRSICIDHIDQPSFRHRFLSMLSVSRSDPKFHRDESTV